MRHRPTVRVWRRYAPRDAGDPLVVWTTFTRPPGWAQRALSPWWLCGPRSCGNAYMGDECPCGRRATVRIGGVVAIYPRSVAYMESI